MHLTNKHFLHVWHSTPSLPFGEASATSSGEMHSHQRSSLLFYLWSINPQLRCLTSRSMNCISHRALTIFLENRALQYNVVHAVLTRTTVRALRCICFSDLMQVRAEASVLRQDQCDNERYGFWTVDQPLDPAIQYRAQERSPFRTPNVSYGLQASCAFICEFSTIRRYTMSMQSMLFHAHCDRVVRIGDVQRLM